jgi:predicted PurR-regulated permease PerM
MPRDADEMRTLIVWSIAAVVVAVAGVWALIQVRQVLLLLYVSALLAIGFSPLVRLIERQPLLAIGTRIPRWLAILVVYLAIIGAVAGIGLLVLPPLIDQARAFWAHLPALLERIQQFLIRRGLVHERVTVGQIVEKAPGGGDMVGTLVLTFWSLFGGVVGIFTVLILTFYLLVDSDALFRAFVRLFPPARRARVRTASEEVTNKVSAWLTGQLILASVIGCTTAIGLGLLGMPYFYVLAVIAAIGELIPYIGPILGAIPGIAVAAGTSGKMAAAVALFYFAQQQTENYLLVPKLMERQVGLSPVGVIVALLLGAALLGIPGAILAVPTAAIIRVLVAQFWAESE